MSKPEQQNWDVWWTNLQILLRFHQVPIHVFSLVEDPIFSCHVFIKVLTQSCWYCHSKMDRRWCKIMCSSKSWVLQCQAICTEHLYLYSIHDPPLTFHPFPNPTTLMWSSSFILFLTLSFPGPEIRDGSGVGLRDGDCCMMGICLCWQTFRSWMSMDISKTSLRAKCTNPVYKWG